MAGRAKWSKNPEHVLELLKLYQNNCEISAGDVLLQSKVLANFYNRAQINSKLQSIKKNSQLEKDLLAKKLRVERKKRTDAVFEERKRKGRDKLIRRLRASDIKSKKKDKRCNKKYDSSSSSESSSSSSESLSGESDDDSMEDLVPQKKRLCKVDLDSIYPSSKSTTVSSLSALPNFLPPPAPHNPHVGAIRILEGEKCSIHVRWLTSFGLRCLLVANLPFNSEFTAFFPKENFGAVLKIQINFGSQVTNISTAAPHHKWQYEYVEDSKMTILIDLPADIRGKLPTIEKNIQLHGYCLLRFASSLPYPGMPDDSGDYMIQ